MLYRRKERFSIKKNTLNTIKICILVAISISYLVYHLFTSLKSEYTLILIIECLINLTIVLIFAIFLTKKTNILKIHQIILYILFVLYLFLLQALVAHVGLIHFVIMKYIGHHHIMFDRINLIPFHTILKGLTIDNIKDLYNQSFTLNLSRQRVTPIIQIIGNILMIVPLSFFILSLRISKSKTKTIFLIFIFSIGIELFQLINSYITSGLQYAEGRGVDVDDIILNTIGAIIGVLVFWIFKVGINGFKKTQKIFLDEI
ncbi:VanZ family protein [Niallia sp. 03091]|uniref:VanZ family protein n=1 Tax=Niallia sp. 03091 TaxID=3458059 RepID=UPI004043AA51